MGVGDDAGTGRCMPSWLGEGKGKHVTHVRIDWLFCDGLLLWGLRVEVL